MNSETKHRNSLKKTRIGRRLEKLRIKPSNLWLDESSASENEQTFSRKKSKCTNPRCLICSILSQLTSHNCCSKHLNILTTHSDQIWLPDSVMIVPVTNELVQKYLNHEQIDRLQTKTTANEENDLPQIASTITIEPDIPTKPPQDPWQPISDEVDAALEQVLDQIDTSFEYSPHTVRHTDTNILASHLPKIPLKEGRFRHGKPIQKQTTTNAANEYRPLASVLSSSPETHQLDTSRATPSRIQIRRNPDGTRVSISRPLLQPNQESPLTASLRRTSTDVEPRSKQV